MGKRRFFGLLLVLCLTPALARSHGYLTACKSNLKNFGTACEMYRTDFGVYPESLSQLTPNYLKTLPECSRSGRMSYEYSHGSEPDTYAVFCAGTTHDDIGQLLNSPAYDCCQGLVEGREPPAEDPVECARALEQVGLEIEKQAIKDGHYPKDLSNLNLPKLKHWQGQSPVYWTNSQGRYKVCCPGARHLTTGHQPFYPQFGTQGLQLKRLPERLTPEGLGKVRWPLLGGSIGVGLFVLFGLGWWARR